ncbi:chaperonin 10-like protein [Aspergillus unguis]
MAMTTHTAAHLPSPGTRLALTPTPTPHPGPGELLIKVLAVAVNPVDIYQRDLGLPPVPIYPAVLGSDVAGIVLAHGDTGVPASAPRPGERVGAFASGFYQGGRAEYGAFQEVVLARWEGVFPLPEGVSVEEGAVLPLGCLAAVSGFDVFGMQLDTNTSKDSDKQGKEGILIWGGASSVGSFAVQFARDMGFRVYATASAKHHAYIKKLGADRVFDYRDADVVTQIASAVRSDGVSLCTAQAIVPDSLQPVLDVLEALGQVNGGGKTARVGHAPPLFPGHATLDGVDVRFSQPPGDPSARDEFIRRVFQDWVRPGLQGGTVVPSPRVRAIPGGLGGLDEALDVLKEGVSGTKLVVTIG